jgi:hypothetical protein
MCRRVRVHVDAEKIVGRTPVKDDTTDDSISSKESGTLGSLRSAERARAHDESIRNFHDRIDLSARARQQPVQVRVRARFTIDANASDIASIRHAVDCVVVGRTSVCQAKQVNIFISNDLPVSILGAAHLLPLCLFYAFVSSSLEYPIFLSLLYIRNIFS